MHKTSLVRYVMPGLYADMYRPIYRFAYKQSSARALYQDDAAISTYITRPSEHLSRWEPKPHELLEFFLTAMISRLARDSESLRTPRRSLCRRTMRSTRWNRPGGGDPLKARRTSRHRISFSFPHLLSFIYSHAALRKSFTWLQENVCISSRRGKERSTFSR